MNSLNTKIGVTFDETHKKTYDLGGIQIQRATSWIAREDDGETGTKKETNVNHLETNPQIAFVTLENPNFPQYKKGDKLFLHYLAYEWSDEPVNIDGELFDMVEANNILFKIEGDNFIMCSKSYLGESVIDEAPKTLSGIFLTSAEDQKNPLKVKILHTPNEYHKTTDRLLDVAKIGDTVITIDSHNYELEYNSKTYVFLKEDEIVAIEK